MQWEPACAGVRAQEELFRVLENELRRVVTSDYVSFFLYNQVPNKEAPRALNLLNRPAIPVPSHRTLISRMKKLGINPAGVS